MISVQSWSASISCVSQDIPLRKPCCLTDRRGYAQWPSSLVWTCSETRCNQRHPQSDGAGNTRYQTTRAPQEDMAPTDEGRHGGRGCYPRSGPRPEGVEKEDKADPYEIGKRPPR